MKRKTLVLTMRAVCHGRSFSDLSQAVMLRRMALCSVLHELTPSTPKWGGGGRGENMHGPEKLSFNHMIVDGLQ